MLGFVFIEDVQESCSGCEHQECGLQTQILVLASSKVLCDGAVPSLCPHLHSADVELSSAGFEWEPKQFR